MNIKTESKPDPSLILDLSTAYWGSMVLFAAKNLGVFSALAPGPLTAEEIAHCCEARPESMTLLLKACVSQGLLVMEGERFRNSETASYFLVEGMETYIGQALSYSQDLYGVWGRLEEAILHDRPVIAPETILGSDRRKTRNFVLGMHNRAIAIASSLAASLDLTGRRRLLDVGGGPATYSRMLVERTPGLHATVIDLPGVVEVAAELIGSTEYADRIQFLPADYRTCSFGSGNDVVLMSGMLHRETEETCQALLTKAYDSLSAGGMIAVSDIFFDSDSKVSPAFTALFALTMRLTSQQGAAHATTAIKRWMSRAGFAQLQEKPFPLPMRNTLITGIKGTQTDQERGR